MSDQLFLDNQYCFSLYSAANAVTRAYRPLLKELDLTYPQYLVMLVLWQHGRQRVSDLGNALYLDSGTLTPLLKRLELKNLIERTRSKEDERARDINLTQRGVELQQQAMDIPSTLACSITLSREELDQLKQLCNKLL